MSPISQTISINLTKECLHRHTRITFDQVSGSPITDQDNTLNSSKGPQVPVPPHLSAMALLDFPLKDVVKESKYGRKMMFWELCQGTEGTGGSEYERRKAKNARSKISFPDFLRSDQICLSCMAHFIFPLSIWCLAHIFKYQAALTKGTILGTGTKDQPKDTPINLPRFINTFGAIYAWHPRIAASLEVALLPVCRPPPSMTLKSLPYSCNV